MVFSQSHAMRGRCDVLVNRLHAGEVLSQIFNPTSMLDCQSVVNSLSRTGEIVCELVNAVCAIHVVGHVIAIMRAASDD